MKVKICGITTLREIKFLNELKPNYIGLVFAESKRKVDITTAIKLCKSLNGDIKIVAVFRNNNFEEIKNVLEKVNIDIIQLHGNEDYELIKKIKTIFKGEIWRGINYKEYDKENLDLIDTIIIDSSSPGSGKTFNWEAIKSINCKKDIFLAGGLNINNIDEALKFNNISGIDLSSGVEEINKEGNREKSYIKVKEIIERVKKYDER